jgi:hypothetical protein
MFAEENTIEISGLIVGFLLTIFVYSFVVKDNPMYRLAVHILVGVSAGFAGVVVVNQVLIPVAESIISQDDNNQLVLWVIPIILAVLLLAKLFPRFAWIGNSSMAVLIAVGSAVGLVGAILGTLIPQITATYESGLVTIVVALLTVCVLAYFHFTGRLTNENDVELPAWYQYITLTGKFVMTIALAGVFAGLFSTTLVLLSERFGFYFESFRNIFTG